ncbi:hypothetical protein GCM10009111_26180 [Colwellia asteriadis]|uniref:VanZ-like domain-containing protein n=1 Tax=Colwellia asteriadis TaxID=517723 RepID=A0ABN1L9R1_9GAMM
MKIRQYFIFLLILLALLLTLAIFPQFVPSELKNFTFRLPKIDTIGHFISFFLLTWVVHSLIKVPLVISVITLIFYAACTEIGQYYLGFRSADWFDFLADATGVISFLLIKLTYLKYVRLKKSTIKVTMK